MNIAITFTDAAITAIADKGFDDDYGARPLRRAIQTEIEDTLSEQMLDGTVKENSSVTCDYRDGKFVDMDIEEALGMQKDISDYEYQIAWNIR